MKKVLTLLALFSWVSVSFAQLTEYQVDNVQNNEMERTDWYGYISNTTSAFIFDTAAEYLLRIPAGELEVGGIIKKVTFRHLTSENFSGYTGSAFGCETYTIKIYTGTSVTAQTNDSNEIYYLIDPGTVIYSQTYSPTTTGIQEVNLTTPFTVPNEDFCISIYAPEKSAGCLCPTDASCIDRSFAYMDDSTGWWHYQFGSAGSNQYYDKPWFLAAYYDDNNIHVPSDFEAKMYNPEDHTCAIEDYTTTPENDTAAPEPITTLAVSPTADSIYAYVGVTNWGDDSSYGFYYLSLYVDGETPYYFWENRLWSEVHCSMHVYGHFRIWEALCGMNELTNLGLTPPFDLCFHIDYEPSSYYYGCNRDPNLDNNTYCVHYTDQEDPGTGIHETTNTLNVYPNPACNIINVDNAAGAQISIFNIAGQEVMAIEAANANETINISNLKEGVYVVRVVNGNEVATRKVSIVR